MTLTPADVHNVAFSRARIGKRGYSEQEVDIFIDLVEQELTRHIEEDVELRNRNAELRNRDGGLRKREVALAEREAAVCQHEDQVRQQEIRLRQQETQLSHLEAQLAQRGAPLPQQLAQLRYREAQLAQHQAELTQQEAELAQWESELDQREAELDQRLDQQQAVASRVGAEVANHQMARPYPPVSQNGANGTSHRQEGRAVASVHGRHDMERMAIRAVTDTLGNTITETVHERLRRSDIDHDGSGVASEQFPQLDQLKQQNAELARTNGLLKAAAALLAAALDQP
ncbi:DivIVA domain-containing protein [Mycobacterium haemophilum]